MECYRENEKEFHPVCVLLNTQEEVDGIYTLFRHNGLMRTVNLPMEICKNLEKYTNINNTDRLWYDLFSYVIDNLNMEKK